MAKVLGKSMITEYLQSRDPTLRLMDEPSDSSFKCFNTGGVEVEVGEFLYGFIRMLKPNYILETGTHMGISSSYMAQALKDNNKGFLTTLEIEKEHIKTSTERWDKLGLSKFVVCDKEYSLEYELEVDVEFMFLDSEPEFRFKELRRFFPKLLPGGYAFIHDAPRTLCQGNVNTDHPEIKSWPFGDINKEVIDLVHSFNLVPFQFGTPRGLFCVYKPHDTDYKWGMR